MGGCHGHGEKSRSPNRVHTCGLLEAGGRYVLLLENSSVLFHGPVTSVVLLAVVFHGSGEGEEEEVSVVLVTSVLLD
jgi:hypothetical protein